MTYYHFHLIGLLSSNNAVTTICDSFVVRGCEKSRCAYGRMTKTGGRMWMMHIFGQPLIVICDGVKKQSDQCIQDNQRTENKEKQGIVRCLENRQQLYSQMKAA